MKLNTLKNIIGRNGSIRVFDKKGECQNPILHNKKVVYVPSKEDMYNLLTTESINALASFSGEQFIFIPNGKADRKCTAYYFNWGWGGLLDNPTEIEFKE